MSGKSSPEFQRTDDDPAIELNNYADSLLEIIALTTSPTFLSRLIFYPRPTLIYVQLFLPSAILFYQKTFISLSNITKPSLKKHFINNCGLIFCFHLNSKSYLIIVPDVFPLGFWSGLIAIRYALYHFQNRSVPTPLRYENHAEKNLFQWKQKVYPI